MAELTPHIDDNTFALEVADFFRCKGDPFLGVEVKPGQPYPLVIFWDDDVQVTRIIACTCNQSNLRAASAFALMVATLEEKAGRAPCGTVACGAWPGGWATLI